MIVRTTVISTFDYEADKLVIEHFIIARHELRLRLNFWQRIHPLKRKVNEVSDPVNGFVAVAPIGLVIHSPNSLNESVDELGSTYEFFYSSVMMLSYTRDLCVQ